MKISIALKYTRGCTMYGSEVLVVSRVIGKYSNIL